MIDEWLEVAIAEQQAMAVLNAPRGDKTIDRLAHRDATRSEDAIILNGRDHDRLAGDVDVDASIHKAARRGELPVIAKALEHFHLDEVANNNPFPREGLVKPTCLRAISRGQKVDPNARINDDHAASVRMASRSPSHVIRPRYRRISS